MCEPVIDLECDHTSGRSFPPCEQVAPDTTHSTSAGTTAVAHIAGRNVDQLLPAPPLSCRNPDSKALAYPAFSQSETFVSPKQVVALQKSRKAREVQMTVATVCHRPTFHPARVVAYLSTQVPSGARLGSTTAKSEV